LSKASKIVFVVAAEVDFETGLVEALVQAGGEFERFDGFEVAVLGGADGLDLVALFAGGFG